MNGDFYYRSLCCISTRSVLSATSDRSVHRARDCRKNIPPHGDRSNSYLCQLYLSLDSRAFLDTVSLHYNELSPFLGKFRLHGRVLDLVYENLATSRYNALNQRLSTRFHESAEFNQTARELYGARSM